jgi:electron transfer flavoprotein alpha subunit
MLATELERVVLCSDPMGPVGSIWVVAEERGGVLERVTLELVGEARRLAGSDEVAVILLGVDVGSLAAELAHHGADTVHLVADPALRRYDPELFEATVGALCAVHDPALVLFAATITGSDLAVRLASERGWSLVTRCTMVRHRERGFEFTRPIGDGLQAVVAAVGAGPQLATIVPDVIGVDRPDPRRAARVIPSELARPERPRICVSDGQSGALSAVDLVEADVIVAAGRGIGSKQNLHLVEDLASALGGTVGGTRIAVDLGWLPRERQIGQTGKAVAPRLYVACGISGATQHTIGMKDSATIVAINKDSAAPIFKIADLVLQADVAELLPALAEACRRESGNG